MPSSSKPFSAVASRRAMLMSVTFLVVLFFAGGASRADVLGQVVTRLAAWSVLFLCVVTAMSVKWRSVAPIALLLLAAVALVFIHLIPLPPSIWMALPGREVLADSATISGQLQPWRPVSISPAGTFNALSSLIVPVVALILFAGLSKAEHWFVAALLLGLAVACSVLALLQFSGASFNNPLINNVGGSVSGTFANRNHFALFAAIGVMIAPAWAVRQGQKSRWRLPAAVGIMLLLVLLILASGSRMGLLLGAIALLFGLWIARTSISNHLRGVPKKLVVSGAVGGAILLVGTVALSFYMDRAVSLDRAVAEQSGPDIRVQSLPVAVEMVRTFAPVGAGFGTFDPAFRIHEPDTSLGPKYLNHAHNDFLEIVLDGGLPGALLLLAGILWWLRNGLVALRPVGSSADPLRQLGWGIILLILMASVPDYPARTPMIMAVLMIAAVWLSGAPGQTTSQDRKSQRPRDRSY